MAEKKIKVQKILTSGKVTVFVDHRERASNVGRILDKKDISVREIQLDVADFVISDRIAIERKTVPDFLNSIINQRLFDQLKRLSESYERPVLIIEGDPKELYTARDMHENTIRGVLSSVAIDYGVPIIWTENPMETAAMVYWIAYREQKMDKREPQIRACKRTTERPRMQEFLVAGLPNINSKLSRRLLSHFRNPREIFSASEERLMEVNGMGKEKVRKVFDLLNCEYEAQREGQENEAGAEGKEDG
jgi:Fanconi anemia group M protein